MLKTLGKVKSKEQQELVLLSGKRGDSWFVCIHTVKEGVFLGQQIIHNIVIISAEDRDLQVDIPAVYEYKNFGWQWFTQA